MTRLEVFEVIKSQIISVVPDLEGNSTMITENETMKNLGLNSIDRTDVILCSMDILGLRIPQSNLLGIQTIGEFVDLFHNQINQK